MESILICNVDPDDIFPREWYDTIDCARGVLFEITRLKHLSDLTSGMIFYEILRPFVNGHILDTTIDLIDTEIWNRTEIVYLRIGDTT